MGTCFALQSCHRYLQHYELSFLSRFRVVSERKKKEKNKTDSTQNQVTCTVQPSFPQRLLTFLPYGDN